MAGPAAAGAGIVGSLISGKLGQDQLDWFKNALMNVLNNQNESNNFGRTYALSNLNPATDQSKNFLNLASQGLFNGDFGSMNVLQNGLQGQLNNLNPSQFQQSGVTPEMQQIMQMLGGTSGGLGGTNDLMQQVVRNGGGSQQGQDIFSALQSLSQGRGANNDAQSNSAYKMLTNPQSAFTQSAQNVGQNSIQNGGMTNSLRDAISAAMGISNAGGSNSNIDAGISKSLGLMNNPSDLMNQLSQAGLSGLQSNMGTSGLTQTGAAGEQTALQGLQQHGANPTTNFFAQRGAQLAGQDAVLPTLLATSLARDEATHQYKNAAEAANTQALSRGGGPGATVANGATNSALADFAEKGAQGISSAVGDTLQKQQALGLQQQQNGAQMGLGAGQIQSSNLGQYGSLLSSLENNAVSRYGTAGGMLGNAQQGNTAQSALGLQGLQGLSGLQSQNVLSALGLIPSMENSATNKAGTFGNLGLGAGQLENSNMALGGNLNNSYNNTILNALQGMQGNVNQANNYTLGAGGLQNNMAGTQGNLLNSILNGQLGGSQQGTNQMNSFYNALNGLFNGQQGLVNSQLNMNNQGLQALLNSGGMGFDLSRTALSGMPQTFGNYRPNSPMGEGVAGAASGMGDLMKIFFPGG